MFPVSFPSTWAVVAAGALCFSSVASADESGFTSLFDGRTLNGWTLIGKHGEGYGVKEGILYCAKGGGGKLMTAREYTNFVFRFEFKLEPGSNNGIGIRAPFDGDTAYVGMEIQVLDDTAPKHAKLRPEQYHGSIYDVVAARRGALKPVGEWNAEEITADGRHIQVVLNGQTIVDAHLNEITNPSVLGRHSGLLKEGGHIGFLGHSDYVEFRNIRLKELSSERKDNTPPEGFVALFNGRDLSGWKGLLKRPNNSPAKRALLSPDDLAKAQAEADEDMRANWRVENGELVFSGKGRSLCTARDYTNFEMYVDWKIPEKGDSGIYLRGSPQVQIWDPFTGNEKNKVGSGGLFNNKINPSNPLVRADHPIGQWNRFHILMQGNRVTVHLNDVLVVRNTVLENYWERDKPIYPSGQIELQNHGDTLWFKNLYIRELP